MTCLMKANKRANLPFNTTEWTSVIIIHSAERRSNVYILSEGARFWLKRIKCLHKSLCGRCAYVHISSIIVYTVLCLMWSCFKYALHISNAINSENALKIFTFDKVQMHRMCVFVRVCNSFYAGASECGDTSVCENATASQFHMNN